MRHPRRRYRFDLLHSRCGIAKIVEQPLAALEEAPARRAAVVVQGLRQPARPSIAVARDRHPRRARDRRHWSGLATSHATALWNRAGALVPIDLDGTKARALAEDEPALVKSAKPVGVRLLANLDPLTAGRDRDLLVPDPAVRKRIWTVLGGPGIVLVDGDVMALWHSTKKGKKVLITVEPLGELTASAKDALTAEAERIAAFRGAETATVHVATP